jgi:predicted nucleic acid-binding protein
MSRLPRFSVDSWRAASLLPSEQAKPYRNSRGLPCERYPQDFLLLRAWELRENLTAYDAVYVALAEILGATLLTCDGRISRAPGHSARVEVI